MQLTEKNRREITTSLSELPTDQANKIAATNGVSLATVYRIWKRIKDGSEVEVDTIVLAIAELATAKKAEDKETHRRWLKVQKQLSAA